jgi:hypothetical protein
MDTMLPRKLGECCFQLGAPIIVPGGRQHATILPLNAGCSHISMILVCSLPAPKTVWVAFFQSSHPLHDAAAA